MLFPIETINMTSSAMLLPDDITRQKLPQAKWPYDGTSVFWLTFQTTEDQWAVEALKGEQNSKC